ncbi:MAG: OmpA family protein, partial [Gammaproteobacteria bacterium]|nr:OmpA family protein [Gammaproteobacteria bacterium]
DYLDTDSDNDGYTDAEESDNVPPLSNNDSDNDGIDDAIDVDNTGGNDADNDGIDDASGPDDTDGDGTPDYLDTDSDNDGIDDVDESGDSDNDGIPDRIDASTGQLETATRGAGALGLMLPLLLLLAIGRRHLRKAMPLAVLAFMLLPVMVPSDAHAEICGWDDSTFEPCWYGTVGLGITHVDPEGQANGWSTNDDSDTGLKVGGGYMFKPRWSAELAYLDAGEAGLGNTNPALEAAVPNAGISYKTPSLTAAYWLYDHGEPLNAYVKFGIAAISNSANSDTIPFDKQNSVSLATGLGIQWRFQEQFFVRGEGDFYDRDHYYIGLGLGMMFGGRSSAAESPAPVAAAAAAPVCSEPVLLVGDIKFETDSFALTDRSAADLEAVVPEILAAPAGTAVTVEAHTDSVGPSAYNRDLSQRRAEAVQNFLAARGIAREQMVAIGYGESQPVADNSTRTGRALNRRVEVRSSFEQCAAE